MFTVVRYMLIRSLSTSALMEITSTPWIPRTVFAASCTAASAALAKLSGDWPMTVMTLAMSAIRAPSVTDLGSERDLVIVERTVASLLHPDFFDLRLGAIGVLREGRVDGLSQAVTPALREVRVGDPVLLLPGRVLVHVHTSLVVWPDPTTIATRWLQRVSFLRCCLFARIPGRLLRCCRRPEAPAL